MMLEDLKLKYSQLDNTQLEKELEYACKANSLRDVKYLLTSSDIEKAIKENYDFKNSFAGACSSGGLEVIDYLLSEKKINNTILEDGFVKAASKGQLEVIKKLKVANTDTINQAFTKSCEGGHLEAIYYLVEVKQADITTDNYKGFKSAFSMENKEIINYLLIENTKELMDYLMDSQSIKDFFGNIMIVSSYNMGSGMVGYGKYKEDIMDLLSKRDLKNSLDGKLSEKNSIKKHKI
jgi:hypothetical protein